MANPGASQGRSFDLPAWKLVYVISLNKHGTIHAHYVKLHLGTSFGIILFKICDCSRSQSENLACSDCLLYVAFYALARQQGNLLLS